MSSNGLRLTLALALMLFTSGVAHAQIGYGVTSAGALFRFDVNSPAVVTTIGNLSGGVVTEGIDFRPGTGILYGLDVGPNTSQLYTIDTTTAALTPVGPGFTSNGVGYTLVNQTIGFDFNPRTLQPDGSMRIRVVATSNSNLRLNSNTGLVNNVDTPLAYLNGNVGSVDASAYINSAASTGAAAGTTTLYGLDARNDTLVTQNPPNDGTLNTVGPFGLTIDGQVNMAFDILSQNPADDTIADELAYAVYTRPDAPIGDPGKYLLYDVNLATGLTLNGRLVGGGLDFQGGFAVIPEPGSIALFAVALGCLCIAARRPRRGT